MAPTPFLDRTLPLPAPVPPGRGSRIVAAVALVVGLGALAAVLVATPGLARAVIDLLRARFPDMFDTRWTVVRAIAAAVSAFAVVVALVTLHECGHVVAGRLAGFRFTTIAIGPLMLDGRFRL